MRVYAHAIYAWLQRSGAGFGSSSSGPGLLPEPLETMSGNAGVMGCVLGIAVAEVVLHRSQIRALVGEVVATGVSEHVGPHPSKLRLIAGHTHDVVDSLASELCPALGDEQPGQLVSAGGEKALDGAQLVARYRVLDG